MSFDEEARQSADALAAHLGREIQDRLQEFVSHLAAAAADERQALAEQAQHAITAAERTLEAAVLRAREETALDTTTRLEAEQADRLAAAERDIVERHTHDHDTALATAVADARARGQATLERLAAAFQRLDEGQALSQLLDILAEEASRETPRCAVFVVRGPSLQGWAFSGFDEAPAEARGLTLALDTVPELAQVVERGVRGQVAHGTFASSRYEVNPLAFMALADDDAGVAVPVTVGGQVAALVYGDEGDVVGADRPLSAASADAIELLARHAARCLEAQTAIRAARLSNSAGQAVQTGQAAHVAHAARGPVAVVAASFGSGGLNPAGLNPGADITYAEEHARRYARLLIADIRLHHEPAVRAGRDARDLWRRLQPEIAKARQSFDDRVPPALLSRDRLFEEELVRTLADGDDTLLGFDTPDSAESGSEGPEAERLAV